MNLHPDWKTAVADAMERARDGETRYLEQDRKTLALELERLRAALALAYPHGVWIRAGAGVGWNGWICPECCVVEPPAMELDSEVLGGPPDDEAVPCDCCGRWGGTGDRRVLIGNGVASFWCGDACVGSVSSSAPVTGRKVLPYSGRPADVPQQESAGALVAQMSRVWRERGELPVGAIRGVGE